MTVSVRSYLLAGAAAATATAMAMATAMATATTIALTAVQVTPPDVTVSAHPGTPQPELTQAMVDLIAAARRTTIPIPVPADPPRVDAPRGNALPSIAAPNARATVPGDVAVHNAASDFIINAWDAALPWIDYGVGLVDGALGWVPGLAIIGNQVSLVWTYFGEPVADSFVRDLLAPVVNSPLNLDTWANGFGAVASTTVNSLVDTGVAEFNYFFGWLIPPIPLAAPTEAVSLEAPLGSRVGADLLDRARAAVTTLIERTAAIPPADAPQAAPTDELVPQTKTEVAPDPAPDPAPGDDSAPARTAETTAAEGTPGTSDVLEATPEKTTKTVTKTPVKPARAVAKNIKRDLQKATAGLRGVVKDIRHGLVKPRKPIGKSTAPSRSEPTKSEPAKHSDSSSGSGSDD